MRTLGVDLSARHSAAVLLDSARRPTVAWHVDAGAIPKDDELRDLGDRILRMITWADEELVVALTAIGFKNTRVVIEDVPPQGPSMRIPAATLRIQGAVVGMLLCHGIPVYLVRASVWQHHFGLKTSLRHGETKQDPKRWAAERCQEFGFDAEPWVTTKAKARPMADMNDAYLIARWADETGPAEEYLVGTAVEPRGGETTPQMDLLGPSGAAGREGSRGVRGVPRVAGQPSVPRGTGARAHEISTGVATP